MSISSETKRLHRVVYFDEQTGALCQCAGSFWKTCPLRAANDLPCQESIISITPIDRTSQELVSLDIRALDKALRNVTDKLRDISKKGIL